MKLNKILVAFDGSENSFKAVEYVVDIVKNCPVSAVTILYVERLPDKDIFPDENSWVKQCEENEKEINQKLAEAKKIILSAGISSEIAFVEYFASCQSPFHETDICTTGRSIGMDILRIREEGQYDTLVVGRRGVSKAQEFLFGSVSTKVVQSAIDCTVWVIN
ncbi:Nucleotide-binding universal stress protein, UspA family [Maridesulfovibrio ferrireducens]|uniref:Nucleotide-binding universal stress protein, UspA family n=1 Tax=Maridesulfovibrio ferrireducens TaxID=246191 RepID=A0A1G9LIK4_9BACT|nr:universal stress protein [Maridesulfovibrio ferrireducens]SDL61678.1 Nucleotide-binding universal stress protein, UspA family [Maridesulfovibrio ferrireducens]